METKLRLAFVKDWHDDPEHLAGNKDGILAAVDELSRRHNLTFISRHNWSVFPDDSMLKADAIIYWGSLDRPWHAPNHLLAGIPKVLCFAGGPLEHPHLANFDHILVESAVYEAGFRALGKPVSRAFGTNTSIFRPDRRTSKVFKAIYPASFCFHKNQELFARAMGSQGLCVGAWNEESIVGKCLQLGTPVMRRVSSNVLCDLFNMSQVTVIPCGPSGGSQRTVLESMACGVPVVLADDNDKCAEFVTESGFGVLVPPIPEAIREAVHALIAHDLDPTIGPQYIQNKWTHHHYADSIEAAVRSVLQRKGDVNV